MPRGVPLMRTASHDANTVWLPWGCASLPAVCHNARLAHAADHGHMGSCPDAPGRYGGYLRCSRCRTTSTEQDAFIATLVETLPSKNLASPRTPLAPTKIESAPSWSHSSAAANRPYFGSIGFTSVAMRRSGRRLRTRSAASIVMRIAGRASATDALKEGGSPPQIVWGSQYPTMASGPVSKLANTTRVPSGHDLLATASTAAWASCEPSTPTTTRGGLVGLSPT